MPAPIPTLLERKVLPKLWGGRHLESLLGIPLPRGEAVGETWEVYDRPDGASRLRGTDTTLHELMQHDPQALLGRGIEPTPQGRFPLLIKFLDAAQALSIQVHPDDDAAAAAGDWGKHEAWIVLAAGPNARILCGLRDGVTPEQLAAVAGTPAVADLLREIRPRAGDAIPVPAGTVHSIGPDVVLYEIQQNSDVTLRLWDWGRPRELHTDAARAVIRATPAGVPATPQPTDDGGTWLLREKHFAVRRYQIAGPRTLETGGTCKILTMLRGRGALGWRSLGEHAPLPLQSGDSVLVPACVETVFLSPIGSLDLLWAEPRRS